MLIFIRMLRKYGGNDDDDDDDDEAKYLPSVPIESAAEDDGYFLDVSQLLQCD